MTNKFAGNCKCGKQVGAGCGSLAKVLGKWIISCGACNGAAPQNQPVQAAQPVREMTGSIYWPNGMGYRECTAEYEELHNAHLDANEALDEFDSLNDYDAPGRSALCHILDAIQYKKDGLQAEGGHLGRVVHLDAPDVATAILGGGCVVMHADGKLAVAD